MRNDRTIAERVRRGRPTRSAENRGTVTVTRKLIALVDDDVLVRRGLERLLSGMGFTVVSFGSAEEFLATAQPEQFDGLLVDVHLRGMSGLELHAILSAVGRTIPTVFISAAAEAAALIENSGNRIFLSKPFDAMRLHAALNQTMASTPRQLDERSSGSGPVRREPTSCSPGRIAQRHAAH